MSDAMTNMALEELIARYLEGVADAAQTSALNAMLAGDAAARRMFVDRCLQERCLAELAPQEGFVAQVSGVGKITRRPHADAEPALRRSVWYAKGFRGQGSGFSVMAAIAALFVIAGALLYIFLPAAPHSQLPIPHSPAPIALLSDLSDNAQFIDAPHALGSDLLPGVIALKRGSAQIAFRSGAVVDLTGPCEFDMTGENRGYLRHGLLTAYVPAAARGFTVGLISHAHIVDLGTRFAIDDASDGSARLRVLEGRVRIDDVEPAALVLEAGQGRRISRAGRILPLALSFDVDGEASGGSITDPDAAALTVGPGAATSLGVSVTLSANLNKWRDRRNELSPDVEHYNLLRDFVYENSGDPVTIRIDGLRPQTAYDLTVYSFDAQSNDQTKSAWFADEAAGAPLHVHTIHCKNPAAGAFTLHLTSDTRGRLRLVAKPWGGDPSIVIFNGLTIAESDADPAPATSISNAPPAHFDKEQ
ncbi:MAG: hypothetical protein GC162_06775 [Planctomycetes bacterium]|nr:hypothetical protein [Planctomycetota bacterium]